MPNRGSAKWTTVHSQYIAAIIWRLRRQQCECVRSSTASCSLFAVQTFHSTFHVALINLWLQAIGLFSRDSGIRRKVLIGRIFWQPRPFVYLRRLFIRVQIISWAEAAVCSRVKRESCFGETRRFVARTASVATRSARNSCRTVSVKLESTQSHVYKCTLRVHIVQASGWCTTPECTTPESWLRHSTTALFIVMALLMHYKCFTFVYILRCHN